MNDLTTTNTTIPVPPNTDLYMSANSHAANLQQLVFSINGNRATFTGSGENVAMQATVNGKRVTGVEFNSGSATSLALAFSYNGGQSPNVQAPLEHNAGTFVTWTITSEDSTDNDDNDTYALVTYITSQASVGQGQEGQAQ